MFYSNNKTQDTKIMKKKERELSGLEKKFIYHIF